jgi:hypothetical protein
LLAYLGIVGGIFEPCNQQRADTKDFFFVRFEVASVALEARAALRLSTASAILLSTGN